MGTERSDGLEKRRKSDGSGCPNFGRHNFGRQVVEANEVNVVTLAVFGDLEQIDQPEEA